MEIKEYSESVEINRAKLQEKGLDNLHMILGMITEIGELADTFKKEMAYGKEIDWINVKEEIGDLLWYVIGFCNINGFDFYDVLEANAKKLKARYPNNFEKDKALNRDLEKERNILNGNSKLPFGDIKKIDLVPVPQDNTKDSRPIKLNPETGTFYIEEG